MFTRMFLLFGMVGHVAAFSAFRSRRLRLAPAVAFAVLALSPGTVSAQPKYTVTNLGNLGGNKTIASGINASGQVVGWSYVAGNAEQHAFLYSGGSIHDLGTLGGTFSVASGINESEHVVGFSSTGQGPNPGHAFLYRDGSMHDLGSLCGTGGVSSASGINASGQVVGTTAVACTASNPAGDSHAFLYSGGAMQDLGAVCGTFTGGPSSATGINAGGQVVGVVACFINIQNKQAFLYSGGSMRTLGTLGGTFSVATGINESGNVVGYSSIAQGPHPAQHAFLYSGGALHDLGTLGGGDSLAYGINDSGQVVGSSDGHAFLYSGGAMQDLNTLIDRSLGITLYEADAINDSGQVVANGLDNNAYLLTPIVSDTTPPVITSKITGTQGNNGWYRSNVKVTWTVTDPESGIASSLGCGPTTVTTSATLTCSATNGAGLSASSSLKVQIDKTPPVISGLPAPGCTISPPDHRMVEMPGVVASDSLSGIAPGSFTVTGTSNNPANGEIVITGGPAEFYIHLRANEGQIYTLTARARDLAGNIRTMRATCTVAHDQ